MFFLVYVFCEVFDCFNVQGFIVIQFFSGFFNDDYVIVVVIGSDGIFDDFVQCDGIYFFIFVFCCYIIKVCVDRGFLK